jgi:NADH:ubiquinone oxidoreductase subunit 4 (subunit M)
MVVNLDYTLFALLLLPLLLSFLPLLFAPTSFRAIRLVGLSITFISAFLGLLTYLSFDKLIGDFQLHTELVIFSSIAIPFGLDGISISFTLLTLMVFPACLLAG